ncbi:hypothetical protein DKU28_05465 [Salmonella enterica subsp. enterica serovar Reading]|nr:hypothetical protein [Salmonella enterica subsp. enterica serovar Reading]
MNTEQIQTSAAGSPGAEAPRFSQQKLLAVSSDIDQQTMAGPAAVRVFSREIHRWLSPGIS